LYSNSDSGVTNMKIPIMWSGNHLKRDGEFMENTFIVPHYHTF